MGYVEELIPAPSVVRERLSRNIKERRRLRSLLRLSIQAAEDRRAGEQSMANGHEARETARAS